MAVGFGSSGTGATDCIQTAFGGRSVRRTFFARFYALSTGGGSNQGVIYRSGNGTTSAALLGYIGIGVMELQFGFSTTNGAWTFNVPALASWHNIAVTFDGASTANNPTVYIDGASVTLTRTVAPVGTFGTTSNAYFVGNNAITGGTRNWDGLLQDLAFWDDVIPAAELPLLHAGFSPLQIHPEWLVEYLPLRRNTSSVKAGAVTVTGTSTSQLAPRTRSMPSFGLSGEAPSLGASVVELSLGRSKVGVAGTVTVSANGVLAGSVTVTPSDGGAGGTFSPTSVTISPGTPTATVSYTPASAGLKLLSTTNTGSLGDASGIEYKADTLAYYISAAGSDAAAGTSSGAPWATIAKVMSWGVVRGATYYFRGGDTFTGTFLIADGVSGANPADRITITSYGTGRALMQAPSAIAGVVLVTDSGGWHVHNVEGVGTGTTPAAADQDLIRMEPAGGTSDVLEDMAITACVLRNAKRGFWLRGDAAAAQKTRNIVVGLNTIHDCWDRAINVGASYLATGADDTWTRDVQISYNHVYNINDPSGAVGKSSHGIVVCYCTDTEVHHNLIHDLGADTDNGGAAAFCWGNASNTKFYRNEIYNVFRNGADGWGIDLDSGARNCLVEWNYIHDCDGAGMGCYEYQISGKPAGVGLWRDNVFRYNVVQNCGKTAFGSFGVIGNDMVGCDVYGNTFVQSHTGGAIVQLEDGALGAFYQATNVSGFRFRNNVFLALNNTIKMVSIAADTGVSAASFDFEGNAYFPVTGTAQISWMGTNYNTVAAWGVDSTAVTADPLLSDPFTMTVFNDVDLISTLTKVTPGVGSPLRNAGLDLKGAPYNFTPTTDFKGGTLPASGAMDIGALDADALIPDVSAAVASTGSVTYTGTAAVVATIVSGSAVTAAVAATGSITYTGTGAVQGTVSSAPPSEGALSDGEMRQMFVWVSELARIHGLVAGSPLVVTPTSRQAGAISQSISESGSTVTVSRA